MDHNSSIVLAKIVNLLYYVGISSFRQQKNEAVIGANKTVSFAKKVYGQIQHLELKENK